MENCERYTELYSSYVDHEMSAAERTSFEKHLHQCASCRGTINGILKLRDQLKCLEAPVTSPDFETILRARIQLSKKIGRSAWFPTFRGWGTHALGFTAAVAVIVFALYLTRPGADENTASGFPGGKGPGVVAKTQPLVQEQPVNYSIDLLPAYSKTHSPKEFLVTGSSNDAAAAARGESALQDSLVSAPRVKKRINMKNMRPVSF